MVLGLAQPLTEISTRNFPGIKAWSPPKADNLTAICEPIVKKMWEPQRLTTLWSSTASLSSLSRHEIFPLASSVTPF
jgi:hypothetical protein